MRRYFVGGVLAAALLLLRLSPTYGVPTLSVTPGGTFANDYLDAAGNWVWNIEISNSDPVPGGSASLATELGFTTSTALVDASNLSAGPGEGFANRNSAAQIFGWEILSNDGSGNLVYQGLQTNCASGCTVTGNANQIFAALSSADLSTVGPHAFIRVVTKGQLDVSKPIQSSITVSGAYAGNGRIEERETAGQSVDYDLFHNVFTRTAKGGDVDLSGYIDISDLNVVLVNFNSSGTKWYEGNFTGARTDIGDLAWILTGWHTLYSVDSVAAAGATSTSAVPEPQTAAVLLVVVISQTAYSVRARNRRVKAELKGTGVIS